MTNAIEQISCQGLEKNTMIFGGMNLAMALTATLMKDEVDPETLKETLHCADLLAGKGGNHLFIVGDMFIKLQFPAVFQ